MRNTRLFLLIIGLFFLLPACSDDDDNDVLNGHTIEATPNNPDYGNVTGAGVYEDGETVILTATPEEGYIFAFWSEDEEMVHDEHIYEFVASDDRTLVAHFSDQDDPAAGFFSVNVSGDLDWSFEGFAAFGETNNPETDQEVFIVVMSDNEGEANFSFAKGGDRPGTGEMNIGNIDFEDIDDDFMFPEDYFLATLLNFAGAEFYVFASNEGNINITESTAESFAGNFSYTATGMLATQPINELNINIEGSFNAIMGDVEIPNL
jgi:hypothetical protein